MNKVIEQALLSLLVPALDAMGEKWKTIVGVVLASMTFIAHLLAPQYVDVPIAIFGGKSIYALLMWASGSLFGVGILHKLAKLPVSNGESDKLP